AAALVSMHERSVLDLDEGVLAADAAAFAELLADLLQEAIDLELHVAHLLAEIEDHFDAGEVDPELAGQEEDRLQPLDGVFVVEAGVAGAAHRRQQPFALVHAQGLWVDAEPFGHGADHHEAGFAAAAGHHHFSPTATRFAAARLGITTSRMPRRSRASMRCGSTGSGSSRRRLKGP